MTNAERFAASHSEAGTARNGESPLGILAPHTGLWADGHCTLRRDQDAVTAGLTLPWSSGVVEGHVNRIKMLKRQRAIGMGIYVTGRPG